MESTAKKRTEFYQQNITTIPITPKKLSIFQEESSSSKPKVKSFIHTKEMQSISLIYLLLVFLWIVIVAFVIFMALQTKIKNAEVQALQEISKCKSDYQINRCHKPIAKLVEYCNQKLACLNDSAESRVSRTLSYSRLLGEVLNEFVQGSGVLGVLLGLLLIGLCLRQKGRCKQTFTFQYFND